MKKLLALVLALVMSMSLVTISNAAFKDADKIDYKEAVDVMNAVGVFIGDEKGNFNAKENLTREQAAKIIAYLELGEKAADALGGSATFTDVAATRWSAGFVSYCAQAGVVAGVGDSKFDPAGQLTALQFGKMLLVEIGYDAKAAGMTGTDWAINTSKLIATTGLMNGIDGSVNQVITREKAAQMALNALKTPTVEYATKGSNIIVNGAEINFGASVPTYVTNTVAKQQTISNQQLTNSKEYTIELGEKLYPDLKLSSDEGDAFGRPANKWTWKNEDVGTYANTGDLLATYTKKVSKADLYSLVGSSVVSDLKSDKADTGVLTVYENGAKVKAPVVDTYFEKNASGAAGISGNGVLTEVYLDNSNNVIIVFVNTYLAKATGDYNTKKETLNIEFVEINDDDSKVPAGTTTTIDNDDLDVADYKEGDYLLITVSEKDTKPSIESIAKAEVKTGKVSEYTVTDYVVIDGEKTSYNKLAGKGVTDVEYTINENAKVVLDKYGYIIYVDEAVSTSSYVFIRNAATSTTLGTKAIADAYFTDGTSEEITLKKVGTETDAAEMAKATGWFTFTKDSDGKYTLTAVKNQPDVKEYKANSSTATEVVSNSKVAFVTGEKGTSSTLFLVRDYDGTVTVYTGITNVPTVTVAKNSDTSNVQVKVSMTEDSKGYAEYVFIDVCKKGNSIEDVNDVADYLFLLKPTGNKTVVDGSTYYQYKVIIDGEETTKYIEDTIVSGNKLGDLFTNIKENSKGYITSGKPFESDSAKKIKIDLSKDVITFKGNSLTVDSNPFVVTSETDVNLVIGAKVTALLKDVDASYETYLHTSASALTSMLKGYSLTGTVYAAVKESGSEKLTALYVYISGAEEIEAPSNDTSIKSITVKGVPAELKDGKYVVTVPASKNVSGTTKVETVTNDGKAVVTYELADKDWTKQAAETSAFGSGPEITVIVEAADGTTKEYTLQVTLATKSSGAMISKSSAVKVNSGNVEIDKIYKDIITVADLYSALDFDDNCGEFDTISVVSAFGTKLATDSTVKVIEGMKVIFAADGNTPTEYSVKFST